MSQRLTFRVVGIAVAILLCIVTVGDDRALAGVKFSSKEAAFTQGYSAYKSRQYKIAVPALKFAAVRGVMRAKFYLAKIYSDNSGGWTNHARAYGLLGQIIDGYANVDPKDYRVAPYVAQALTSIARYERDGIKAIQLPASTKRALVFFDHAATYFSDEDAQFELAKHYLSGDGVQAHVPYALNWLARLSKRGHAGAQAFLANLYWDGRYTRKDPVRALALVTVAVENAREEDRFWIEDLHQSIFCDAKQKTRQRVHQVVGGWRQRFGRTENASLETTSGRDELGSLSGNTQRVCANGDVVGYLLAPQQVKTPVLVDKTGTINAAVSTLAVPPSLASRGAQKSYRRSQARQRRRKAEEQAAKMSRLKSPAAAITDRSALNGFTSEDKNPRNTTLGSDPDHRSLNGFVVRGQSGGTSFGLSLTPGQ